ALVVVWSTRPPGPPLFPYTTLFRSEGRGLGGRIAHVEMDFRARPARPHVPHFPEVRFLPETHDALMGDVGFGFPDILGLVVVTEDRKSTRLNSSHVKISYAVFCLKK